MCKAVFASHEDVCEEFIEQLKSNESSWVALLEWYKNHPPSDAGTEMCLALLSKHRANDKVIVSICGVLIDWEVEVSPETLKMLLPLRYRLTKWILKLKSDWFDHAELRAVLVELLQDLDSYCSFAVFDCVVHNFDRVDSNFVNMCIDKAKTFQNEMVISQSWSGFIRNLGPETPRLDELVGAVHTPSNFAVMVGVFAEWDLTAQSRWIDLVVEKVTQCFSFPEEWMCIDAGAIYFPLFFLVFFFFYKV
jgi:hypothetical protein